MAFMWLFIQVYVTNNIFKLIYKIYFTLLTFETCKSFNFYVYSVL